jgi:hypothetical protein
VPLIHNKAKLSGLLPFARPASTGHHIHYAHYLCLRLFLFISKCRRPSYSSTTSCGLFTVISRRHSSLHQQPLDHLVSTNDCLYEGRFFPGASLFGGSAYLWRLGAVKMKSIPSVRLPLVVNARAQQVLAWTNCSHKRRGVRATMLTLSL